MWSQEEEASKTTSSRWMKIACFPIDSDSIPSTCTVQTTRQKEQQHNQQEAPSFAVVWYVCYADTT
jgi:hypothetical protein